MKPIAQLLNVPRTAVPVGSAAVCRSAWPAAGPVKVMGVLAVMRRAKAEGRFTSHWPPTFWISMIDTPCAAWDLAVLAAS